MIRRHAHSDSLLHRSTAVVRSAAMTQVGVVCGLAGGFGRVEAFLVMVAARLGGAAVARGTWPRGPSHRHAPHGAVGISRRPQQSRIPDMPNLALLDVEWLNVACGELVTRIVVRMSKDPLG